MSWASKYIDRYIAKKVKKYGMKGAIIWFIGQVVKYTPTKKDDQMFAEVKKVLNKF
jgi:hypothetical protein